MKHKEEKTNAIRLLEQKKLHFKVHDYAQSDAVSGLEVADYLNENPDRVFKTLVTVGKSTCHYVFLVPVNRELDLKKAAKAVNEKSIEMIKTKELLPLTGYIHGGCSPVGMKKFFTTVIDASAKHFEEIFFSGGKIGLQIEMGLPELQKIINFRLADISSTASAAPLS
ncbi:MAG: Cys-tRNA(Pro) deacylase [Lachnospiraceae bacterium]|nr:Cys-tRNA(Pro) deacylase [Lachnospiraceae bacterium]